MEKRVLILGNSALAVFGMRAELIQRLVKEGCEVIVSLPSGILGDGDSLAREYGCTCVETAIDRRGTNVFRDAALLRSYIKLIRDVRPDVVLTYTVKCTIYGAIACGLLKVPCIVNITGLGKGLAEPGLSQKVLVMLYKVAVRAAHCVFFQNADDRQFFADHGIRCRRAALLPGSGVNLEKFTPLPYPSDDRFVFTYVSRVMKTKGIDEFLEAARVLGREFPNVEFHVCGFYEDDYKQIIERAHDEGVIQYHGQVADIRPYEAVSHCIVLPTYHPEGVPNVLLEAAACGRPFITTDRPGCRDVLEDGVNGYLVQEKNSRDLMEKMRQFLELPWAVRRDMGLAGRARVEREFDRQIVVQRYMDCIESI